MHKLISDLHFDHPAALWLLPLSLLVLTLCLPWLRRSLYRWSSLLELQQHHYRHPQLQLLNTMPATTPASAYPGLLKHWFVYAVLFVLLHLTLAQPYRLGERLPAPPQYRDIVFLVDTSVSMILRDYLVAGQRIDRMRMVKSVLHHFINQLTGSRLSLVAFSEKTYTLVPLTTDHALLQYQLQRLEPASLTGRRTDPGKALLSTLNELSSRLHAGEKPVLVMLTDANRPVRDIDPRIAAALVKQQGLRLYTIAIGAGSQAGKEKSNSNLIYQPANIKLLASMALAGGGQAFRADSPASLQQALQTIQAGAQQPVQAEPVFIRLPLYYWPLGLALLWVLLWQTLPLLRPGK